MGGNDTLSKPGVAPPETEAPREQVVPAQVDRANWLGSGRFAGVQQGRAAAAGQIQRSLKAWRKASDPSTAEATAEAKEEAPKGDAGGDGPSSGEAAMEGGAEAGAEADAGGAEADAGEEKAPAIGAKIARKIFRDDKDKDKAKAKPPAPVDVPKPEVDEGKAMKILQDKFGGYKEIVKGKVEVLALPEYKAAWQKIYGGGPYDWATYVAPKGPSNGFAFGGVSYINKDQAGTHTVVHEVLHNNAAGDWVAAVGPNFDEGVTDFLTVEACNAAAEPAPVCYPGQNGVVQTLIGTAVGVSVLKDAYFSGGAAASIGGAVTAKCVGSWAEVKAAMDAGEFDKAKAKLQKKK